MYNSSNYYKNTKKNLQLYLRYIIIILWIWQYITIVSVMLHKGWNKMGIFGFLTKKNKDNIIAPINGKLLELSEVPDKVFSQKIMGEGFGIKSIDGEILSPVDGIIKRVFDTKNALVIKTDEGLEIFIHLGIDAAKLEGKGFEVFVSQGQKIKAGDNIINMDLDFIRNNAKSDIGTIIFTNLDENKKIKVLAGNVTAKETKRIFIK